MAQIKTYGDVAELIWEITSSPKGLPTMQMRMNMENALLEIWSNVEDHKFFDVAFEVEIPEVETDPVEIELPPMYAITSIEFDCTVLAQCQERPLCRPVPEPLVPQVKSAPRPHQRTLTQEQDEYLSSLVNAQLDTRRAGPVCWWCDTDTTILVTGLKPEDKGKKLLVRGCRLPVCDIYDQVENVVTWKAIDLPAEFRSVYAKLVVANELASCGQDAQVAYWRGLASAEVENLNALRRRKKADASTGVVTRNSKRLCRGCTSCQPDKYVVIDVNFGAVSGGCCG